ncbi:MAG: pyridoxamine 5'-phosphate oxidase family protein [Dehalococcoidia bacterium]
MFETAEEIEQLQALMDRSYAAMNAHMADIVAPERRLTAARVCNYLQNVKHVSFATVNTHSEPLVAPLDGWFIHGRFIVSTGAGALRVRHIEANPAVSLAHVDGDEIGIWAHGTARRLQPEEPLAQEWDRAATAFYSSSPSGWGDIAAFVVEPRKMFGYAMDPAKF